MKCSLQVLNNGANPHPPGNGKRDLRRDGALCPSEYKMGRSLAPVRIQNRDGALCPSEYKMMI